MSFKSLSYKLRAVKRKNLFLTGFQLLLNGSELVIEGRLLDSRGVSVDECSAILERHGCMQAMNLDGGTSAILWYDGESVTRCSNPALPDGRQLPNAFVYARASK